MTEENYIKLDSFMKWQNLVETGGQAKLLIQNGEVRVNGKIEVRRGRKLVNGDKVTFKGKTLAVEI
ncbi:MAG TPA: RNA-binding S4 domain-containing protein [Anaerolineae bacterium]|nr:RNA-binding S4 domain-containing protein [Anaerolineae bacterium]